MTAFNMIGRAAKGAFEIKTRVSFLDFNLFSFCRFNVNFTATVLTSYYHYPLPIK